MSVSEAEQDLSSDERARLELIRGSGGIHQSGPWKELDISPRKGSRIAEVLEPLGLVKRTRTAYDGHTTYYLEPATYGLDLSMLMVGDMLSPPIDKEEINANSSVFSQWLMNLVYEEH